MVQLRPGGINRLHQTINIRGQAPYRLAQQDGPGHQAEIIAIHMAPVGGFQVGQTVGAQASHP